MLAVPSFRDRMLVEQNVKNALEVATRGYVFETGRVFTTGTRDELLARSG